jgi:hypothetical protein
MSGKLLLSAIYGAVVCLPLELSKLISTYLLEVPHSWTAVDYVTVKPIDSAKSTETATEIVSTDTGFGYPWRTLVSADSFATGCLNWSVEFTSPAIGICQWIGIGVTRQVANLADPMRTIFSWIATNDDWIVTSLHPTCLAMYHNGDLTDKLFLTERGRTVPTVPTRFSLTVAADPETGSVTAIPFRFVDGRFRDLDRPMTLLTASTATNPRTDMPDLLSLRPCVVVAGRQATVVVRSGLSAVPDDE